jgi:PAS domain S-box-containing protein
MSFRPSLNEYQTLAEQAPIMIWRANTTAECDYFNDRWLQSRGRSLEQECGNQWTDGVHPEDLQRCLKTYLDAFGKREPFEMEYRLQRRDGVYRWVLDRGAPFFGENCEFRGYIGSCIDVTERIEQTEEAQRQSAQNFLTLANCIPDTIFSMDLSGNYTYVSPSVQRTFGWTVEEALKLKRSDVITAQQARRSDPLLKKELEKAALPDYDRNTVLTFESEQVRKDGSTFWVEINASFIWGEDGEPCGWTGVARDITDRKRAEAEREGLSTQLAQSQKMESIGLLAGGVAHDFNNLLTVINGHAKLALAKLTVDDRLRPRLVEILKAGERASALTQQLLAFSRKQVLRPCVLDLNEVVLQMRSILEHLMGDNVGLRFHLHDGIVPVFADAHQLEQVIMNLAVNARDAMPHGGCLRVETAIVDRDSAQVPSGVGIPAGRYGALVVTDTGLGMDETTRQRVFEPFFTTKGTGIGTGLGLSMVQGIVAQSAGYIAVDTAPGEGTAFKIYLPLRSGAVISTDAPPVTHTHEGNETVLVVEDRPDVREYVSEALKERGYRVIEAANADEALTLCRREAAPIHLVLSDVMMPGISGVDMVDRLAKIQPGIKALFMSGYSEEVVRRKALHEASRFIQKPFTPDELAERVRTVLTP